MLLFLARWMGLYAIVRSAYKQPRSWLQEATVTSTWPSSDSVETTRPCEQLICDALNGFDDETDNSVEEFLPQLCSMFLGCAESEPLDNPAATRLFAGMRHCLEAAVLRRCESCPLLAAKLAWLLEDIASTSSSTPVVERAKTAAITCRAMYLNDAALGDTVACTSMLFSVVNDLCEAKVRYQWHDSLAQHAEARMRWVNKNLAQRGSWCLSGASIDGDGPACSRPILPFSSATRTISLRRFLPSETVVLNSASRVPLMVFAEVVEASNDGPCSGPAGGSSLVQKDKPVDSLLSQFLSRRVFMDTFDSGLICFNNCIRGGFGELWFEKTRRIQGMSVDAHLPGWRLVSFLVKAGDEVRREGLAMQWIRLLEHIWAEENVPVYVRPYSILCCGARCGLLENVVTARSVDSIKKGTQQSGLLESFSVLFPSTEAFRRAQQSFMRSLVAYSIITYVFQVRDRHNGNILIDEEGHCVHIDFGYILGDSPGRNLGWEKAPFKLTKEFYDVLGGIGSPLWFEFMELTVQAFGALRSHVEEVLALVRASVPEEFERKGLRDVLFSRIMITDDEVRALVHKSTGSAWTMTYDILQRVQNGII